MHRKQNLKAINLVYLTDKVEEYAKDRTMTKRAYKHRTRRRVNVVKETQP
jgi:hypothetical protein